MSKTVIVTTKHRGVFFGELIESNADSKSVRLANVRCAIRFGTKGGFIELANTGPTKNSRIGDPAPSADIYDVTMITDVTAEAAEKWRAA